MGGKHIHRSIKSFFKMSASKWVRDTQEEGTCLGAQNTFSCSPSTGVCRHWATAGRGEGFILGKYSVKMRGLKKKEQELCSASTDVADTNSDEGPVTLRDYRDKWWFNKECLDTKVKRSFGKARESFIMLSHKSMPQRPGCCCTLLPQHKTDRGNTQRRETKMMNTE